jgi:hypothetical protein
MKDFANISRSKPHKVSQSINFLSITISEISAHILQTWSTGCRLVKTAELASDASGKAYGRCRHAFGSWRLPRTTLASSCRMGTCTEWKLPNSGKRLDSIVCFLGSNFLQAVDENGRTFIDDVGAGDVWFFPP